MVATTWKDSNCWHPNPLVTLHIKLKKLKSALKSWNADVFGNINDNLQAAYEEVSAAEVSFDSSPTIYNRESLNRANAHLKYAQRCEEMFWSQKACLQWLDDGDKNTKFFHAIVQSNRRRNYISRLKIDGSNNWCDDQAVLRDDAARYFESLLSSDGSWEEATQWISSMIFIRGTLLFASCLLTRMMPLMSQSGRCCKIALSLPGRWFLICKSCPVFIFRKTRILASGPTQLMVFSTLDRPTTSCALGAFRDLLWQRFGTASSFGKHLCFAGKSSTGYKHFYAKDESTHPSMVSTHQHRFKGKMCKNVETVSTHVKSVSTRVAVFQKSSLPRLTHSQSRSTLDPVPRTASLQIWDSRSTHSRAGRHGTFFPEQLLTYSGQCNKPGHMKGECPENKNEKHKRFQKYKKLKAMVATWSDEDTSEEEEEKKSSSSEGEEVCFMANSSDGKVSTSFDDYFIEDWQDVYAKLVEKYFEMRKENKHIKKKIENIYHNQSSNKRIIELESEVIEMLEEKENLLKIDDLNLASQKASQEFKDLIENLEIEKQEKQQKIEEIEILKNQLKEREEVIQTFTKGKDNLEALLGTNMTTTSHGLGFNKKKPQKDKSGEKKGKAPLVNFVKGPNLENTEIQQTANKTQNKSKTQKQKKTIRSTQSPDRSTCSTPKIKNNSNKNSNKNLKNKKKGKEIIHEKPWTSKTTLQENWTNPWNQWYENPCWYYPQYSYPNFWMYQHNPWIPPPRLNSNFQMKNSPPTKNKDLGAFIPKIKNKQKKAENTKVTLLLKWAPLNRYKHFYANDESTHPSMVSTHQHRFKGKMCKNVETVSTHVKSVSTRVVDTLSEQVDTRPSSQNSQFADLGQQVDTLKSRLTRDLLPRTTSYIFWTTPLKHSKEADPVEDFFGEEFEEDPTSQIAEYRLGLQASQVPVDSKQGPIDRYNQSESTSSAKALPVDNRSSPVDRCNQSEEQKLWKACACRQ
ncbi:hypothetical protein Taro_028372 [Colocasia esculenta]|uniref:Uncharacterized protein n=1 Tax=Colocasia esculenta TaxID=4460 RepID=A0A843VIE0_COLES|nr:hypothetical protein [Colocasia esculenta]